MLLFHEVSFSKLKCLIDIVAKFFFTNMWINIVKKRYNFFRFVQINEFGVLAWLLRLEKSVFLNCIPTENEFHSLIYTGIFSDSQNFRRVISISLNSELVPDYLIVTLLPPGGVFRF